MSKGNSTNGKVKFQGFVNVSLTKRCKENISKRAEEPDNLPRWIENLCSNGYKVSISWVEKPGYFSATAYQNDSSSAHAGYGTTARHSDLHKALAALDYQVNTVLAEEGWQLNNGNFEW